MGAMDYRASLCLIGLVLSLLPAGASGLVDNRWFLPGPRALAAKQDFAGTLVLAESAFTTDPAAIAPERVLGKNPRLFPAVRLSFFSQKGDLVPVSQDVLRSGSVSANRSYWDIIVQPGKIWSEPGEAGWSRASFPFALVHSLEGETHNGVALFAYKDGQVSDLHFQVIQQTAPFYIPTEFTAWGTVPAKFERYGMENLATLRRQYASDCADRIPIRPWADLVAQVGAAPLADFDGALPPGEIVLSGLFYRGAFYLRESRSATGPLPYLDRARFGVWSVTKSAVTSVALLRLAQKYGERVFVARIGDYLKPTQHAEDWRDVTFADAINMATGLGNGSTQTHPNAIFDGEVDATYATWYEARSERDKVAAVFATSRKYPWAPGTVARYRDQDMFVLGAAMDAFLKAQEGPGASLDAMLRNEVYAPIGIRYFPINRTIEPDGREGLPLMAFGFYPTIGDLVKIARLFHEHGEWGGHPILDRARVDEILASSTERGLPTGISNRYGGTNYFRGFWRACLATPERGTLFYPQMDGYGGNYVVLMPGGVTAIRLAKCQEEGGAVDDTTGMAATGFALGRRPVPDP